MALNSSGTISIGGSTAGQSINLELGRAATTSSNLNETALRTLAGVASGAIALNNFYGKSNAPVTVSWSMLILAGGGGGIDLYFGGIYLTSNTGPFPASIDDETWTEPLISDDGSAPPPPPPPPANSTSYRGSAGGGGGGLVTTTGTNTGGSLYITVGAGGSGTSIGGSSYYSTTSGGAAVVSATGGGSGAYGGTKNGGSGGGQARNQSNSLADAAAGTGTSGQGNAGGTNTGGGLGGGGGKNGAGAAGLNTSTFPGGAGGAGYDLSAFKGGSANVVAYGGGGCGYGKWNGAASNDGATGSATYTTYTPPANTGGGIRGCTWYLNSVTTANRTRTGGSGLVIVRYAGTTAKATGGNSTYTATVGGTAYYFHEFTSSGTITFT